MTQKLATIAIATLVVLGSLHVSLAEDWESIGRNGPFEVYMKQYKFVGSYNINWGLQNLSNEPLQVWVLYATYSCNEGPAVNYKHYFSAVYKPGEKKSMLGGGDQPCDGKSWSSWKLTSICYHPVGKGGPSQCP